MTPSASWGIIVVLLIVIVGLAVVFASEDS